jgi:hypothetical protein
MIELWDEDDPIPYNLLDYYQNIIRDYRFKF